MPKQTRTVPLQVELTKAIVEANPRGRKNKPKPDYAFEIPTKAFIVPTNKFIAKKAKSRITLPKIVFKDAP